MADIGNLLPKMRPLRLPGIEPAKAIAAERFAGWTLYLAAVAYFALFGFASVDEARQAAAAVGISAIILIALNWAWLLRNYPLGQVSDPAGETNGKERRITACLLFSFVYVLLTACLVYLFGSSELLALWATVGFSAAFAVFNGVLGAGRPGKHL
jgi:hypothetical protein